MEENNLYNDIKKRLKVHINNDRKKMADYDRKINRINLNRLDTKIERTIKYSSVAFALLIPLSLFAVVGLNLNIAQVFHGLSFSLITLGTTLGVGTAIRIIKDRKALGTKNFSNTRTESEKIKEEILYRIEREKIYNRKLVREKVLGALKDRSLENNIDNKGVYTSEVKMIDKVNSLSLNLTNELQELDTLSTRKILNEESYTKSTIEKVLDFMESSQFFLLYGLEILIMQSLIIGGSLSAQIISSLTILGGFGIAGCGYTIWKNNNYKKAFQSLDNDALPSREKRRDLENVNLQERMEKKIESASNMMTSLQITTSQLANKQKVDKKVPSAKVENVQTQSYEKFPSKKTKVLTP